MSLAGRSADRQLRPLTCSSSTPRSGESGLRRARRPRDSWPRLRRDRDLRERGQASRGSEQARWAGQMSRGAMAGPTGLRGIALQLVAGRWQHEPSRARRATNDREQRARRFPNGMGERSPHVQGRLASGETPVPAPQPPVSPPATARDCPGLTARASPARQRQRGRPGGDPVQRRNDRSAEGSYVKSPESAGEHHGPDPPPVQRRRGRTRAYPGRCPVHPREGVLNHCHSSEETHGA